MTTRTYVLKAPSIPTIIATLTGAGGVVALVLGALDVGNLAGPIDDIITGLGGVLVALTAHHTTKAAVAPKTTA